jgi:hypothetical protein
MINNQIKNPFKFDALSVSTATTTRGGADVPPDLWPPVQT